MSGVPKEFIDDPPRQVPGCRLCPPPLQLAATVLVTGRFGICGIYQDVRIDDEHLRLSPTHSLVQLSTVGRVDKQTAARQFREWRQLPLLVACLQEKPQRGFDQCRHRGASTRRLLFQASHDLVINVNCRLHISNHMKDMAVRQSRAYVLVQGAASRSSSLLPSYAGSLILPGMARPYRPLFGLRVRRLGWSCGCLWEVRQRVVPRRGDVRIEGSEPCLELFGLR